MNYREIAKKLIEKGYLNAPRKSKLNRVGFKVIKRRNMQSLGIHVKDIDFLRRRDPVWLSINEL